MTLKEVFNLLLMGGSAKRPLEGGGWQYLRPIPPCSLNMYITHIVAGESNGGWGGVNDLPLEALRNGHWEQDGWVEEK